MLFQKTGLAAALVFVLAACASNSGNSGHNESGRGVSKTVSVSTLKQAAEGEVEQAVKHGLGANINLNGKYTVNIGGKIYREGAIDLAHFRNGFQDLPTVETLTDTVQGTTYTATRTGRLRMYQQPYSVVAGYVPQQLSVSPNVSGYSGEKLDQVMHEVWVKGEATQTLPQTGSATYKGEAFSVDQHGTLTYTVNFDTQKGSGNITGIQAAGKITLNEAGIGKLSHTNSIDGSVVSGHGIAGTASSEHMGSGNYKLGFFGPDAKEIAGAVYNHNGVVGFGGQR